VVARLPAAQRQSAVSTIARLAGNRGAASFVRALAPPVTEAADRRTIRRYEITLDPPDGPFTDASLATIRTQLTAWGVANPGDLSTINGPVAIGRAGRLPRMDGAAVGQAMQTIEALRTMGGARAGGPARAGGRRPYHSRVVAAWNAGLDDLGPGRPYPTILHFIAGLDELAQNSLGMTYLQALRTPSAYRSIRIAGLAVEVHPRAVYFTAAAQAGMDVRAGRTAGQGHYVAPGAFVPELIAIWRQATSLGRRPAGRRGRPAPVDPEVERLGARAFNAMRGQVRHVLDVLEVQAGRRTMPGVRPGEHPEPGLQQFLLPKAAELRALPEARTADQARDLSARLASSLEGIRAVPRSHGGWAVDPHGTAHAMGLAIDMFNGVGGEGVYQNFSVPPGYWPFVHMVLEQRGVDASVRGMRPTAVHQLTPERARAIAAALRTHGAAVATRMRGRAAREDPRAVRARRATIESYRQLAQRALTGCYRRWQVLTVALSRRRWYSHAPEVRATAEAVQRLLTETIGSRAAFLEQPPATLNVRLLTLNPLLTVLHGLGVAATRRAEAAATAAAGNARSRQAAARQRAAELAVLEGVRPGAAIGGHTLEGLQTAASASITTAGAALSAERDAAVRAIVNGAAFNGWFDRVTSAATPMYTQPSTMIDALNEVLSHEPASWTTTHFFGGHHWEVAPQAILADDRAYVAALRRDMASAARRRTIERVLAIMAESTGGRAILTGREALFMEALRATYPNAEALITAALGPATGETATGGALAQFLRERGFRYLAGEEAAAPARAPAAAPAAAGGR
jgi:hypothetical protein